ncbi:MAG: TetR/AcrR family transcriptional regulator [Methanobacterium sp.]|jgi:AcrR family transcriptional regulator
MGRISKDPELRKKEFIETADKLFREKGFDQTSTSDITDKIGLSHGSLFYYFPSKNELMKAVICNRLDRGFQSLNNIAADPEKNALQKINSIFNLLINPNHTKGTMIDFFQNDSNAALHREFTKRFRELFIPLFSKIFEQGVREGLFKVEYPKETIEYLNYIFENLFENVTSSKDKNEHYRKIKALEIIIAKSLGVSEDKMKLLQY